MIGRIVAILAMLVALGGGALAQPAPLPAPLKVGIVEAPPFVIRGASGNWQGISVALFAAIAAELDLHYTLVEADRETLIDDLASGRIDVAVGPVAVSPQGESRIDFTHSYFQSALGVAEASDRRLSVKALSAALTSAPFLVTVAALLAMAFAAGMAAWLTERRRNAGQFEPDAARGLFSGFWWAVATLTTVGYGDKAPVTVAGRAIGIVWMLATTILLAILTAQLSATLTADRIASQVNSISELSSVRVGYVEGSTVLQTLEKLGARPRPFPDVAAGLKAVQDRKIDAFVHDAAVLLWSIGSVEGVTMAPVRFAPQSLAFAVPEGSTLREPLNRALLDLLASDQWTIILRLYLGPNP